VVLIPSPPFGLSGPKVWTFRRRFVAPLEQARQAFEARMCGRPRVEHYFQVS
jgi:hypothetical protein